ncbi:hypothetical protein PR202_ga19170 [Eleusine coracana subsp. coracana]|uniref:RWD domain-containing protein n=1 Tax=Eleusine coracana subsp. coracana TaxID=191504 RepID=A0AAV5CVH3_ELECO|nr:hypothetical protein PR202_ga19170 [Eleusine coracana subsp. coracana]
MLMALEAIYGDDLAVFGTKGGLRYFQIYIHYDVANGIGVCAKFSSNACCKNEGCSGGSGQGDRPGVFSYNCNFEYLPPLILTCLLPRSYPSKDPPYFTLTVKWMDGPLVSQLCEMLDTIWAELPGQEVVYQWVEWLRNSSRSHIWFDGKMTLGPDIATDNIDNHVISRKTSLDSVIPMMLTYSSKKRQKAFLQDVHMCTICLNQSKEGCNKMSCGNCGQLLCFRCGRAISGYDHFWSEGCVLFELRNYVDVTPYERHMEEVQIERRRRVELIPIGSTVRCPKCRERNFKEDEKYIFCWACRIHYCSLRRMRIEDRYMRSGHYGSSECVGLARAPGSVSSGIGAIGLYNCLFAL